MAHFITCIIIMCYVVFTFGKLPSIPSLPKLSRPKVNKIKAVKNMKRGIAIGGSIGASVPIMNEFISLNSKLTMVKSKIGHIEEHVDMSNPSLYTTEMSIKGEPWSYYKMLSSILNNNIIGVSIHQDGKYAFVIENTKHRCVLPEDIHKVVTIPNHINELIDNLMQYDIKFDVFM